MELEIAGNPFEIASNRLQTVNLPEYPPPVSRPMHPMARRDISRRLPAPMNLPQIALHPPQTPASTFSPIRAKLRAVKAFLTALAFAVLAVSAQAATSGAVIREEGAIYLEDLLMKPARLATVADAPIFYKNDLGRYLGTLKKGQIVELQAVSDTAYRVRGMAQQGQVAGWVDPKFLNPLKQDFLDGLKQNDARRKEVLALIARNEVAINMTPEEVMQALGKPAKKSSKLDAKGREDVWEFVRYERVPQESLVRDAVGNLVRTIIYVKVPAGKISVTFSNNLVTSLEQSEGTLDAGRVSVVTAPFFVPY